MRVFVTGATGFIGSAVVEELIKSGHQVVGLARSETNAAKLRAAGAEVQPGSLEDVESLRRGSAEADGVIHLAFNHDFSKFRASARTDKRAIEVMGAELAGSTRHMVVASGVAGLRQGKLLTEDYSPGSVAKAMSPRKSEEAALALVLKGVNASVVRLPPAVHGDSDQGFTSWLIKTARKKGVSAYIGKGLNRWSSVHRLDAAHLFRLALEKGTVGARYHATADEGIPVRDVANIIGRRLNLPVATKSRLAGASHFGVGFGFVVGMDCPTSSKETQTRLGWSPVQPSLLDELELGDYYYRVA